MTSKRLRNPKYSSPPTTWSASAGLGLRYGRGTLILHCDGIERLLPKLGTQTTAHSKEPSSRSYRLSLARMRCIGCPLASLYASLPTESNAPARSGTETSQRPRLKVSIGHFQSLGAFRDDESELIWPQAGGTLVRLGGRLGRDASLIVARCFKVSQSRRSAPTALDCRVPVLATLRPISRDGSSTKVVWPDLQGTQPRSPQVSTIMRAQTFPASRDQPAASGGYGVGEADRSSCSGPALPHLEDGAVRERSRWLG